MAVSDDVVNGILTSTVQWTQVSSVQIGGISAVPNKAACSVIVDIYEDGVVQLQLSHIRELK